MSIIISNNLLHFMSSITDRNIHNLWNLVNQNLKGWTVLSELLIPCSCNSEHKRDKSVFYPLHVFPILRQLNEKSLFKDRPVDITPCRDNEHNDGKKVGVIDQEANAQENISCVHRVPDNSVETM